MPRERYWIGRVGALYCDTPGKHVRILTLCLNDPEQGPVVLLPIVRVGETD